MVDTVDKDQRVEQLRPKGYEEADKSIRKGDMIMNEEIETAMKRVMQALEAFEESKTFETALELEWKLTHLKLFLTPDIFD